jgi:hypothetical protein
MTIDRSFCEAALVGLRHQRHLLSDVIKYLDEWIKYLEVTLMSDSLRHQGQVVRFR